MASTPVKEQVRVHIRWTIRRDMPEVIQTEQASFDFAWTEKDFLLCLRQRNCIGMVAEQGEKVVGFMIYELHKGKLYILNFAVCPSCLRLGVGSQMVAKLISKLSSQRRTRIELDVRETNVAAQLFFRAQSFEATRIRRCFYEDSGEDAINMVYELRAGPEWDGVKLLPEPKEEPMAITKHIPPQAEVKAVPPNGPVSLDQAATPAPKKSVKRSADDEEDLVRRRIRKLIAGLPERGQQRVLTYLADWVNQNLQRAAIPNLPNPPSEGRGYA